MTASCLEEALIRATGGDPAAFADLVREHQAMVFSLAWHFLRDRSGAEELAQEVFLQLYRNLSAVRSADHLRHWLRKVTCHRAIDQSRRRTWNLARNAVSLDDVPEPAAVAPGRDLMLSERLGRLVESLPAKARMVVILRYQEDLEYQEIADALGMPINTVKSTLQRAHSTLREKLGRLVGGISK